MEKLKFWKVDQGALHIVNGNRITIKLNDEKIQAIFLLLLMAVT